MMWMEDCTFLPLWMTLVYTGKCCLSEDPLLHDRFKKPLQSALL